MEESPKSDPLSLSEIFQNTDITGQNLEDAGRPDDIPHILAAYEVDDLIERRSSLLLAFQDPKNDTPEARTALQRINDQLLAAQADRNSLEPKPDGTD